MKNVYERQQTPFDSLMQKNILNIFDLAYQFDNKYVDKALVC